MYSYIIICLHLCICSKTKVQLTYLSLTTEVLKFKFTFMSLFFWLLFCWTRQFCLLIFWLLRVLFSCASFLACFDFFPPLKKMNVHLLRYMYFLCNSKSEVFNSVKYVSFFQTPTSSWTEKTYSVKKKVLLETHTKKKKITVQKLSQCNFCSCRDGILPVWGVLCCHLQSILTLNSDKSVAL